MYFGGRRQETGGNLVIHFYRRLGHYLTDWLQLLLEILQLLADH